MATVDLCFPVLGNSLPVDHGYALYAAISRVLGPDLHDRDGIGLFSVRGLATGDDLLSLTGRSQLRVRAPVDALPALLKLSGKALEVEGHSVRLGIPRTLSLIPAASVVSRLVTVKGFTEPEPFLEAVRRQLDAMAVRGCPEIPLRESGEHAGEPVRRVLRIKDKSIVGFALVVSELATGESLTLQERGLGGRRHMGCGLFLPIRERKKGA